jgi:CubicO group peptidase (beta-lactamase class C family)
MRHRDNSTWIAIIVLAVGYLGTSVAARAQSGAVDSTKAERLDALVTAFYRYHYFSGSVLVAEHGQTILSKGYGMANREWDAPNAPDTKFLIASVTKQFTASIVMQLAAEGRINLEGKLSDYLPYYRQDTGKRITIAELLSHSSGVPDFADNPDLADMNLHHHDVREFVNKYCSGDLLFTPGSEARYSNSGYYLLGAIIQQITGKPYEENLQDRIFRPLGMTNSGFMNYEKVLHHRADGYERRLDEFQHAEFPDPSVPFAAGAIYSTTEDLYKWDQALYTNKIVSEQDKAMMFQPRLGSYGFGWRVERVPPGEPGAGVTRLWHTGNINGFGSLIERLVDSRNLIILLNNSHAFPLDKMRKAIEAVLYDKPYEMPKPSVGDVIKTRADAEGVDSAVSLYHELRDSHSGEYNFGEEELNALGEILQSDKRFHDAIRMFTLNTEAYPQSSLAAMALAGAYVADGQKGLAVKTLEKALATNPKDSALTELLKRIQTP